MTDMKKRDAIDGAHRAQEGSSAKPQAAAAVPCSAGSSCAGRHGDSFVLLRDLLPSVSHQGKSVQQCHVHVVLGYFASSRGRDASEVLRIDKTSATSLPVFLVEFSFKC